MKVLKYVVVAVVLSSCVYHKEEVLPIPENEIPENPVTYTNFAKKVIDNNCVSCHSSGGQGQPPFLSNYNEVFTQKSRIQARCIDGSPSYMPPTGSLPQPILDTLQLWLDQGALQ